MAGHYFQTAFNGQAMHCLMGRASERAQYSAPSLGCMVGLNGGPPKDMSTS